MEAVAKKRKFFDVRITEDVAVQKKPLKNFCRRLRSCTRRLRKQPSMAKTGGC